MMKNVLVGCGSIMMLVFIGIIAIAGAAHDKEAEEFNEIVEIYENVTYVGPVTGGHEVLTEANTTLFFASYDWDIDAVPGEELRVKFGGEKYMTIMKK